MSLFQKSIEKKYLNELDTVLIEKKYKQFQDYFGNLTIQENIRNAKEEQFQEGFLRELFVSILGYTLNPQPNFNLTTELKNIVNSKKADGAIMKGEDAIAVIELKGTDTTDLDKIETQAFGYKNHHPKCVYVITSNFEKLRFYIQNAVDHLDFDLFRLSREQFSILWLCLSKDNLLNDLPLKIKESSVLQEENITKKLYADYSKFREAIYTNLVKNNPETDKLLLFKKTQKLLDRFLFIFFAEDRLLLPPNSISEIVKQWKTLKDELDEYVPLYDRFKKYFGYMNTGYKGKQYDIYAYNGGLFAPDEILDNIAIDDDILHHHTLKLSNYDFETDVDVNILGHIFEHSLGEIENVQAEIKGEKVESDKTKRKKDGIFYTPKYITKYIVENTIGKLCETKRTQLNIIDEEYAKGRKNRKKETITSLDDKLTQYRNWLLSLTILDPACGSGAFLNQALDFLITEHRKIDDLRAQLFGAGLVFSDITTDILEKNIYGIDLNEESIEIAKLSLWLRTAQKGRKLNKLNNNIKCGNSLISDPAVAGDKAFNWQNEFPNIFTEKRKKAWHVTTATHNSRYSQRMFDNHVVLGKPEWIDEEDAIIITETIAEIAINDKLNILEYNICGDHMHLLLVCEEEELTKIVGKLKSISAKIRNRRTTTRGHAPLLSVGDGDFPKVGDGDSPTLANENLLSVENDTPLSKEEGTATRGKTEKPLWTQKFGKSEIKDDEYLNNAIVYIRNNRVKHHLPPIKEIEKLKNKFLCTQEHAFRAEYNGGFDVVIGNPPYVNLERLKDESIKLEKVGFKTYSKKGDLYVLFIEKGFRLLKPYGLISYIMPNKWLQASYGQNTRELLLTKQLHHLIDFGDIQIFDGATTYPCIFFAKNDNPNSSFCISVLKSTSSFDFNSLVIQTKEIFETSSFNGDTWVISSKKEKILMGRLNAIYGTLNEYIKGEANYGIKFGLTEAFLIDNNKKSELLKQDLNSEKIIGSILRGRDLKRYGKPTEQDLDNIILAGFGMYNEIIENYPAIYQHLLQFEDKLKMRGQCSGSRPTQIKPYNGQHHWLELDNNPTQVYLDLYAKPKIMYQKFQVKPCFIYDEQGLYCNDSMWIIPTDNKALLGVLNSKMGWWLITKYCTQIQNGCQLIWKYFGEIPIPELNSTDLTAFVEQILVYTKKQQVLSDGFLKYLNSQYTIEKLSRKLESWYNLDFADFITELNKAIKQSGANKLTKSDEMEWMELFESKKAEAQKLKAEIEKTDHEIDQLVYQLYNLTPNEIAIIESSK